jgi:acyl-CoA thioester hydrolase
MNTIVSGKADCSAGRPGPDTRADYVHFYAIAQRWMDNDVYRHMNNVVYYSFFDTAVNQYLIERGALDIEKSPEVGLVVETQCRYFSPIVFPSMVNVGMRVDHIGTSSLRYAIALFSDQSDIAAAQGYFIHVYVDRATNRPIAIPERVRTAVLPLLRPQQPDARSS